MEERRRQAQEEPLTPTQRHSNVFGDEHEALDMDVVDGFRPHNDDDETQSLYTASAQYALNPVMTFSPPPSRSSTRKSRTSDNPFANTEDVPPTRTTSTRSSLNYAPGLARRSFSSASASSHRYATASTHRLAAAGPSHPYTMYPQGTIVRSPSVATASTTRPPRRSTSLRHGPQHPYGMYTQGIADSDDDDDENSAANPIPVGFGLGQTYRRVRGPEGEEQDIIGDYGHAEQLPPYSRYPDDGPEKAVLLAVPEDMHTRAPIEGTDPGMPLMHQRLSRQSMTDASQLEQSAPLLADIDSTQALEDSSSSSSMGNKSWKEMTWKEKRRKRICGVRFGWILVTMACVGIILAILVGSLVGYWAGVRKNKSSSSSNATTTYTTSLFDASLIATPTNSPATGSFALTLGTPQATQADCLVNPTQRAAWNCNLVGKPAVVMSVGLPPAPSPSNGAFLFYASNNNTISYGAQYQFLQTQFSDLIPVQDNDDPTYGPAFYFQQTYDKIVVVPEDALTAASHSKRQYPPPRPPLAAKWSQHKQMAKPGERPWFCFFNNTAIEGFLYVQKPAIFNVTTTSSSSAASTATPTSSTTSTTYSIAATTARVTTTTPGPTGMPSSVAAYFSSRAAAEQAQHATETTAIQARGAQQNANNWAYLYPYPYMVKLEERRVPNNTIQPYCQQYQILDNDQYNVIADASGAPIQIQLDEHVPQPAPDLDKRDPLEPGGCHCQWMHGAP